MLIVLVLVLCVHQCVRQQGMNGSLIFSVLILMCLQFVAMDPPPYRLKNKENLGRLLVRTEIPGPLEARERKLASLNGLEDRIKIVEGSVLAGDEAGKLVAKTILEVNNWKRDLEESTRVVTSEEDKASALGRVKSILKKYEKDDNLMEEREIKEIRRWLFLHTSGSSDEIWKWLYHPETRTPLQILSHGDRNYKYGIEKVYKWPRTFNFPRIMMEHGNDVNAAKKQMLDFLNSGLTAIEDRKGHASKLNGLRDEWRMRVALVDSFTSGTTDASEIYERMQAFEGIVLALLTKEDGDGCRRAVLKKWLLMHQMMYAVDGISDQPHLTKPWRNDALGGGFPLSTFDLPVPRLLANAAKAEEEVEIDTEPKRKSKWGRLAERTRKGEVKAKAVDTSPSGTATSATTTATAAAAAATTADDNAKSKPKSSGWFGLW